MGATASEWHAAQELKEGHGYVALDFQSEQRWAAQNQDRELSFSLPDGNSMLAANAELFRCPEALFQPRLVSKDVAGIHEMAFQAIKQCDVDVRRALTANVVLSGGSVLFEGFQPRLVKELSTRMPPTMPTKVELAASPRYAPFIGGSILASLGDFMSNCISRRDYEEWGISTINSRSLCLTGGAG